MRQGKSGEVILERSHDRRYTLVGLFLPADPNIVAINHVLLRTGQVFEELKKNSLDGMSAGFVTMAGLMSHTKNRLSPSTYGTSAADMADRFARSKLRRADISLDPLYTDPVLSGLEQVTELQLVGSLIRHVRPQVAEAMLERFWMPPSKQQS